MPQKVEDIKHNGILIAVIIRAGNPKKEYTFFSPEKDPLQVGNVVKKKGSIIKPHIHKEPVKTVRVTQEVLYIEEGKLEVDLYAASGELVYNGILEKGDKIFLASGGHGFKVLEDATIFEVKQGPYPGYEKAKHYLSQK